MKTVTFSIQIDYDQTAGKTYNQISDALADALPEIGIDEFELRVRTAENQDNRDEPLS